MLARTAVIALITAAAVVLAVPAAASARDGSALDHQPYARAFVLQQAGDDSSGGLTQASRVAASAVVAVAVVALAVVLVRRTRRRRRQLAIVRPNLDHAVTQGLPNVPAMVVDRRDGAGRVIALAGAARRAYDFASVPLRIGSATDSDVRIEPSPDVAPRHAAIYMRDRKIVLRHMGGSRRPTFVGGQPVDLVILEDGDEFVVGPHKFRAEIVESIVETDIPDAGMPEPNGSEPRLV